MSKINVRLPRNIVATTSEKNLFNELLGGLSTKEINTGFILIREAQILFATKKQEVVTIEKLKLNKILGRNETIKKIDTTLKNLENKGMITIIENRKKDLDFKVNSVYIEKSKGAGKDLVLDIEKTKSCKSHIVLFLVLNSVYRPNNPTNLNRRTIFKVLDLPREKEHERKASKERILKALKNKNNNFEEPKEGFYNDYIFTFSLIKEEEEEETLEEFLENFEIDEIKNEQECSYNSQDYDFQKTLKEEEIKPISKEEIEMLEKMKKNILRK